MPQKEKKSFASVPKEIWLAPITELARKRAYEIIDTYSKRFCKVVQCLENGLEDSLTLAKNPLTQHCKRQLNSILQESFLSASLGAVGISLDDIVDIECALFRNDL